MAARPVKRFLPPLGLALATGGLLLLGWVAHAVLKPIPAPYHYQQVAEADAGGHDKLDTQAWPNLAIGKYEMRVDGIDKPVAVMHVARRGDAAPVMIDWDNRSEEPLASLDVSFPDLADVAQAIDKYTPKDALVLAWWDTSRQIQLLCGRKAEFDAYLGQPVILPAFWRAQTAAIEKYEREFWGAHPSATQQRDFARFADALSEDVATGTAGLRELAGGREAYLVVQVSDIYKLGLMRPDRLGIASRSFRLQSDIHGNINAVDQWMREKKYSAYGLQKLADNQVRAYFLTDVRSGNTLLAQMLPFTTSKPTELRAVQLVYQHGGYWIYKLPAAATSH
ncbi:MAG: hydroxylamine oxidation protein HaoB [Proteobacteria bacterium]|nr:hydroxylamine oxidation protein HaoB [Pseudomonadota bacterium]